MSGKLMLEIATPEKLVFSGEVDYVTAPGGLGEFTVLPKHTPLLTTISPGILKFFHWRLCKRVCCWMGIRRGETLQGVGIDRICCYKR